jgi:hypothetical protein
MRLRMANEAPLPHVRRTVEGGRVRVPLFWVAAFVGLTLTVVLYEVILRWVTSPLVDWIFKKLGLWPR